MGCELRVGLSTKKVCVLALVLLSQLCISLIHASSDVYREHVNKETTKPQGSGSKIVREFKLYSHCSERFVQIRGQRIVARGDSNNEFALLRAEADNFAGRVRIQSAKSHYYVCFNKKGRLTIRHSGKSNRCVFKEIYRPEDYIEFQSVAKPDWYIGFRQNGKPLKGYQWPKRKSCFQFTKTDYDYVQGTREKPPPPVGALDKLLQGLRLHENT